MNLDIALCLPRESSTTSLIRGVVSHALLTFGVTSSCVDKITLALSEACTNVIEHAAADDEYEVRFEVHGDECSISVKNTGAALDATTLSGEMPDDNSARGRGVAIMHAVMDQVNFTSEPELGTIVHLVKRLEIDESGPLARLRRDLP